MPSFLEHISNVYTEPNTGCWLWPGAAGKHYGVYKTKGVQRLAHRLSWEYHNGPIPLGMHVLHKCDVPLCVNPDHLWLGTHLDNVADMNAKGRHGKTTDNGVKGERNYRARLSTADVIAIRASTDTQRTIAARYGIGQSAVCKIRRGINWSHVGSEIVVNK